MDIPFMRLDRQFAADRDEYMAAVEEVFAHGRVLQGPEVAEFERRISDIVDAEQAVAVGSATDALYFALLARGIGPGDRVAVPSLTFIASASAIVRAGATPVFVDIEDGYQPNTEALLQLVKAGEISGIVYAHMFGQMADLRTLYAESRREGVVLIEDAAQCLGAERFESPPGTYSDMACLSFDPTKIVGAQGSGGMLVTHDPELAERVVRLRYHGKNAAGEFEEIGFNSQMASVQAALLSKKLNHMTEWLERRIEIAGRFTAALEQIGGIEPPRNLPGARHVFHKYVVRVPGRRDAFASHLREHGIGTMIHYETPLHCQPVFSRYVDDGTELPEVDRASEEVLSLPIYPELTDIEVDYICAAAAEFDG